MFFLDQKAYQVHIGGEAIHVLRHFIRPGGHNMAALAGQPNRVAGALAVLQPQRSTAQGLFGQFQRKPVTLPLEIGCRQPHTTEPDRRQLRPEPLGAQAPLLLAIAEQVAATLQLLDAQRVRCSLCTQTAKP
ncbi:hypothetical protein D3C72_1581130 [compost metagenome]